MPIYFTDGGSGLQLIPKEYENSVLIHHGVKGQKHGIRRWQNEDGSLTPEGYIHYGVGQGNKQKSDTKEKTETKEKPRKSLSQRIKERIQSMYLPPNMIGKSKEEIKAWEEKEKAKFDIESKKEQAEINFGKQLERFDKLDSDVQKEVLKNVEDRLDKLHSKKFLTHDERKIEDGLKDWLLTAYYNKRKVAEQIGKSKSDEQIAYLDSLSDGSPEKAKAIEDILRRSDEASEKRSQEFADYQKKGYSWTECHQWIDSKLFADPDFIELTNLESWLSGQISTKSGDWYWTTGVSDGFKKITDRIHDLRQKDMAIYNEVFKDKSSVNHKQLNKMYENDPRIVKINKEIDELTAKMPEQVLKDLGVPINEANLERIKPFVFWD